MGTRSVQRQRCHLVRVTFRLLRSMTDVLDTLTYQWRLKYLAEGQSGGYLAPNPEVDHDRAFHPPPPTRSVNGLDDVSLA